METRLLFCEKHRQDYAQCFISGPNVWSGECSECRAEEKLSARVDELLVARRVEKWSRVDAIMARRAAEIETEIDKAMLEEREDRRAEWRGYIEEPIREEVEAQVEHELRREILSSLKKSNELARAAS